MRWLPVQKIPVSSKYFGRPKGLYRTTHEYLASPAGRHGQNSSREIYPAETLRFKLPQTLDGEVHWKFRENQVKEMPPSYVFELENVRFWGHYAGSIITPDDRLLADLSHDVLTAANHKIFNKFKLPRCRRINGTVAVLATAEAATNYWHWTFDLLPRFHLLQKAGFDPSNVDFYLVNHTALPFQLETLAELGIRPEQIIRTTDDCHIEAERLVVSSLKPSQFHVASWVCDFLRTFANKEPEAIRRTKLYISRAGAKFRRLTCEKALIACLGERGFEVVHCEQLSVKEQRQTFSRAEVVVAPHGSGLTNLAYCSPQTAVVEIFSPNYVDIAFWTHSSQSGFKHGYVLSRGNASTKEGVDPLARTEDIDADPDELSEEIFALLDRLQPKWHERRTAASLDILPRVGK